MSDIGFRDLGSIVPGAARLADRAPAKLPPRPALNPVERPSSAEIPGSAGTGQEAAPGLAAALGAVAEMIAHAGIKTPIGVGLFGPPGAGKTLTMETLVESVSSLSAAAQETPGSPFIARLAVVRIDAAQADGNPAKTFAASLYESLCADYPACAAKALENSRDPRIEARDAVERLDAGRRRLGAERQVLEDADARRARLTETVLYETAGSQIESYATANRNKIANSLTGFGVADDPILHYKHMVRTLVESGDGAGVGFALRAFWALKGQTRLLTIACLLVLTGFGLGAAVAEQATWLGWLRANEGLAGAAAFLQTHMSWLSALRQIAFLGAAFALAANVWRALRLIRLVLRGAALLRSDLSARRREADAQFAHHTRRVETLAAECDALARRAAEAEHRAGALPIADGAPSDAEFFGADRINQQARRFIASVGALAANARRANDSQSPQRILVAIDNLDAAPIARAREILACARALFGRGFVIVVAVDPARGDGDGASLDWIDAPIQAGEIAVQSNLTRLVRAGLGETGQKPASYSFDVSRSSLDEPLSEAETLLLEDLAPIAARSPRAVKRFVSLYRLARAQDGIPTGALAFMLALDAGGTETEIAAVDEALSSSTSANAADFSRAGPRLAKALAAVRAAQGETDVATWRQAAAAARIFSFRN